MPTLPEQFLPAEVKTLVAAVWSYVSPDAAPVQHRLLPDGSTDLLIRFDEFTSADRTPRPTISVIGPTTVHHLVMPPKGAAFLSVRVRPEAAEAVFRVSPAELLGRDLPVTDCSPHLRHLADRLAGHTGFDSAAAALLEGLSQLASQAESRVAGLVREAVRLLGTPRFGHSVAGVARAVGTTERTLHRQVLRSTGLSPKVLARIFRFQRAVSMLGQRPPPPLCEVALYCGYSDQSHLCREVRSFAGVSPAEMLGSPG